MTGRHFTKTLRYAAEACLLGISALSFMMLLSQGIAGLMRGAGLIRDYNYLNELPVPRQEVGLSELLAGTLMPLIVIGAIHAPAYLERLGTFFQNNRQLVQLTVIAMSLALGAFMVLGIPMVFGPNGTIDPYGYRQYDEPETPFQVALSCLAIIGPLVIGGLLISWALRQRR